MKSRPRKCCSSLMLSKIFLLAFFPLPLSTGATRKKSIYAHKNPRTTAKSGKETSALEAFANTGTPPQSTGDSFVRLHRTEQAVLEVTSIALQERWCLEGAAVYVSSPSLTISKGLKIRHIINTPPQGTTTSSVSFTMEKDFFLKRRERQDPGNSPPFAPSLV